MRYASPRMPTSIDFRTAVARGHCRWTEIIMHLLSISASLWRSRPLSQHTTSTNSFTLGPSPAMAAGSPPRNPPLCPTPPEFSICIQTDIDKVLEVVVVAHVVYQGLATVERPCVELPTKVALFAIAAVVAVLVVLNNPVSARTTYSVP